MKKEKSEKRFIIIMIAGIIIAGIIASFLISGKSSMFSSINTGFSAGDSKDELTLTGQAVSDIPQVGPSQQEQQCMMECMKCSSPGVGCTGNQQECQTKCN